MEPSERAGLVDDALDGVPNVPTRRALSSTVPRRGSQEADVGVGSKIEAVDVPTAGPTSVEAGYDSPKPNQVDAVAETSGNGAGPAQAFAGSATGSALSGSASPAPSTPSSSYLPLPPLPIEVFLRVMQYLEPVDVVSSRRVSSLWCNSINGEPRLWRDLTCSLLDDVTDQLELYSRYARPRAAGQTGGVTNLTVVLEGTAQPQGYVGDLIPTEFAVHAFKRLVHLLAEFAVTAVKAEHGVLARQGGTRLESSLRTLRVNLEPQSQVSIWVLHVLSRLRTHPLFGQLESLDIRVNCPSFPLGDNFLSMFPTLSRLSIRGSPLRSTATDTWAWQYEDVEDNIRPLDNLREIVLRDVRIVGDTEIPPLPALSHIAVNSVYWENRSYYLLVRMARKTLERLELVSMMFQDLSDPGEDFNEYLDIRDPDMLDPLPPPYARDPVFSSLPLPIYLPRLRCLRLNGLSPALWSPEYGSDDPNEYVDLPTPYFVMPGLVECDLSEIMIDLIDELEPSVAPLAVLGKVAPSIRDLCLHGVVTDDRCLFACFYQMHGRLLRLDLSDSSASDHFICRLPDLTPMLRELDVRGCPDISVQGVARVVEVIRQIHDEGQSKLSRVWIDPPAEDEGWPEFQAYEWLAFLEILQRHEYDYEGDGPTDPKERRKWVRRGKLDVMHEFKAKYAAWERAQAARRAIAEKQAAAAGSSSRTAGLSSSQAAPLTALALPQLPRNSTVVPSSMLPSTPAMAARLQQASFPVRAPAAIEVASQPIRLPDSGPRQAPAPVAQAPGQALPAVPEQPERRVSVEHAAAITALAALEAEGVPTADVAPLVPVTASTPRPIDARDFAPQPDATQPASTPEYALALHAAAEAFARAFAADPSQAFARARPPLVPPTVPTTTTVSPSKRKIESTESLDFDVANVDPGFVAEQAREMERLEQAQAVRLQAQIDHVNERRSGSARAKLQKVYQEQQHRRSVRGDGAAAEVAPCGEQPVQNGRQAVADCETESDDDGRLAWGVVQADLCHTDEEEPVAEVIVSDEEVAARDVVTAPAVDASATAAAAASARPLDGPRDSGADGDEDDDELRVVPVDATTERLQSPDASDVPPPSPGTNASDEAFVPLV